MPTTFPSEDGAAANSALAPRANDNSRNSRNSRNRRDEEEARGSGVKLRVTRKIYDKSILVSAVSRVPAIEKSAGAARGYEGDGVSGVGGEGWGATKSNKLGLPHNGVFIFSPVNGIAHR